MCCCFKLYEWLQIVDEKQTTVYKRALDMVYSLKMKVQSQSQGQLRCSLTNEHKSTADSSSIIISGLHHHPKLTRILDQPVVKCLGYLIH